MERGTTIVIRYEYFSIPGASHLNPIRFDSTFVGLTRATWIADDDTRPFTCIASCAYTL